MKKIPIGRSGIKTIVDGNVEFVTRETGEKVPMKPEEAAQKVIEAVNSLEK